MNVWPCLLHKKGQNWSKTSSYQKKTQNISHLLYSRLLYSHLLPSTWALFQPFPMRFFLFNLLRSCTLEATPVLGSAPWYERCEQNNPNGRYADGNSSSEGKPVWGTLISWDHNQETSKVRQAGSKRTLNSQMWPPITTGECGSSESNYFQAQTTYLKYPEILQKRDSFISCIQAELPGWNWVTFPLP